MGAQLDTTTGAPAVVKRFRGWRPREGAPAHALAEAIACAEANAVQAVLAAAGGAPAAPLSGAVVRPLTTFVHKGDLHAVLPRGACDLEDVLAAAAAGALRPPTAQAEGDGGGGLPLRLVAPLFRALLDGLHGVLHSRLGLLHHDVKPGNVLLLLPRVPAATKAEGGATTARGDIDDDRGASPSHGVASSLGSLGLGSGSGTAPSPTAAVAADTVAVTLIDLGLASRRAGWRPVDAGVVASAAAAVVAELAAAAAAVAEAATSATTGDSAAPDAAAAAASNGKSSDDGGDDGGDDWFDPYAPELEVPRWAGGSRHQVITAAYRPAALLFGARSHDAEADGWSAGVVLAELLRAALTPGPPQPPSAAGAGSGGGAVDTDADDAGSVLPPPPPAPTPPHRLFPNGSEIEALVAQAALLGQLDAAVWGALAGYTGSGAGPGDARVLTALPGYMGLARTCWHCRRSRRHDGGGTVDDAGDDDPPPTAAQAVQAADEAALLGRLADAAAACGADGLRALLLGPGGLCTHRAAAAAGDRSPPALHHAHGVAALAAWTGLAGVLQPAGPGAPPSAAAAVRLRLLPRALGLFELALRLLAVDPARRLPLGDALVAASRLADSAAAGCANDDAALLAGIATSAAAHRVRAAAAAREGDAARASRAWARRRQQQQGGGAWAGGGGPLLGAGGDGRDGDGEGAAAERILFAPPPPRVRPAGAGAGAAAESDDEW